MEDPFGNRLRAIFLAGGLGLVAHYALADLAGGRRTAVLAATGIAALVYAGLSLRARWRSRDPDVAALRRRFAAGARSRLRSAPFLPFRGLLWLGLGTWAWVAVFRGTPFPLGGGPDFAQFIGRLGLLLGAKYLAERWFEVPRFRETMRDLEA